MDQNVALIVLGSLCDFFKSEFDKTSIWKKTVSV